MTELRFEGVVEGYEADSRSMATWVSIGGVDIIERINATFPRKTDVKVTLAVEPEPVEWRGRLLADHGWTGTEVTPGDPPEIIVGGYDLVERLRSLDEREVILIVEAA